MTAALQAAADRRDEPADPPPKDAGQRGSLKIADRVVEKIAAQAVSEVDLATGAPRSVLGLHLGSSDGSQDARAEAHVDGGLVTVSVIMAVQWPASVRQVAEQVRVHLKQRITDLTGLAVAEVDVNVPTLVTTHRRPPRVR